MNENVGFRETLLSTQSDLVYAKAEAAFTKDNCVLLERLLTSSFGHSGVIPSAATSMGPVLTPSHAPSSLQAPQSFQTQLFNSPPGVSQVRGVVSSSRAQPPQQSTNYGIPGQQQNFTAQQHEMSSAGGVPFYTPGFFP